MTKRKQNEITFKLTYKRTHACTAHIPYWMWIIAKKKTTPFWFTTEIRRKRSRSFVTNVMSCENLVLCSTFLLSGPSFVMSKHHLIVIWNSSCAIVVSCNLCKWNLQQRIDFRSYIHYRTVSFLPFTVHIPFHGNGRLLSVFCMLKFQKDKALPSTCAFRLKWLKPNTDSIQYNTCYL